MTEELKTQAPTDMKRLSFFGYLLIIITLGIFFTWAVFSRLDSGAIATGEIIPSGKVLTIQHKEGGVIKHIFVKDGDFVKKNDILLELDNINEKSELQIGQIDKNSLEYLIERLEAEKNGDANYDNKSVTLNENTHMQYQLYTARKEKQKKDKEILEKRISQTQEEILGYQSEISSLEQMLISAKETNEMNTKLYQDRYIDKRRVLESHNNMIDLEGKLGKKNAQISQAQEKIVETQLQIKQLKNQWKNDLLEQLKQAKDQLAITNEKIKIVLDKLSRSSIKAPRDGKINALKFNTIGGVIRASEEILEIVPENEKLIVEGKLKPDDIDVVHPGLNAYVRISAYKQRTHNAVKGQVTEVSANTFKDSQTGLSYYKFKIEIDPKELQNTEDILLQVGMLAQIEIVTGQRTALYYFIQPLVDSFDRSFKEE